MRIWALCVLALICAHAQTDTRARFETASVKASAGAEPRVIARPVSPGRVNLPHFRLKNLIPMAYGVQPFLISGGPDWLQTEPYDITGELPSAGGTPPPQSKTMEALQVLLEERFRLRLHRESKIMPLYELRVTKSGFKPEDGADLPESAGGGSASRDEIRVVRRKAPISSIIPFVSLELQTPVVDRTGLTGLYSFAVVWRREPASPPEPGSLAPPINAEEAAMIAALRSQLGLELQKGKGPVEMLVIESAQRPSEN
ncbi:MAG TPA: TIGR03435 family protein [Verrucomicrobiae bacterium]|nr:TIGR03435 family protein [Verrucomicrobiae bacterium]